MDFRNYVDDVSSSVKPKNNGFLIVFIATVITVLVDSQIGLIADFIPEYLTSSWYIIIWVTTKRRIDEIKHCDPNTR